MERDWDTTEPEPKKEIDPVQHTNNTNRNIILSPAKTGVVLPYKMFMENLKKSFDLISEFRIINGCLELWSFNQESGMVNNTGISVISLLNKFKFRKARQVEEGFTNMYKIVISKKGKRYFTTKYEGVTIFKNIYILKEQMLAYSNDYRYELATCNRRNYLNFNLGALRELVETYQREPTHEKEHLLCQYFFYILEDLYAAFYNISLFYFL